MREEPEPRTPSPTPSDEHAAGSSVGTYLGLGLQFAAAILLFLYLGQWLDRRFGTAPWLLLACVFLGAGGSFYGIYRRLMRDLERDEARTERSERERRRR